MPVADRALSDAHMDPLLPRLHQSALRLLSALLALPGAMGPLKRQFGRLARCLLRLVDLALPPSAAEQGQGGVAPWVHRGAERGLVPGDETLLATATRAMAHLLQVSQHCPEPSPHASLSLSRRAQVFSTSGCYWLAAVGCWLLIAASRCWQLIIAVSCSLPIAAGCRWQNDCCSVAMLAPLADWAVGAVI